MKKTRFLLSMLVGWLCLVFLVGSVRAASFGLEVRLAVVGLILFGLFSTAITVSYFGRSKKSRLFALLMIVSMALAVEIPARIQELAAIRTQNCPHVEPRWWPHQAAAIFCGEDGTWDAND